MARWPSDKVGGPWFWKQNDIGRVVNLDIFMFFSTPWVFKHIERTGEGETERECVCEGGREKESVFCMCAGTTNPYYNCGGRYWLFGWIISVGVVNRSILLGEHGK